MFTAKYSDAVSRYISMEYKVNGLLKTKKYPKFFILIYFPYEYSMKLGTDVDLNHR